MVNFCSFLLDDDIHNTAFSMVWYEDIILFCFPKTDGYIYVEWEFKVLRPDLITLTLFYFFPPVLNLNRLTTSQSIKFTTKNLQNQNLSKFQ